jgi:hypothetical protein
MSVTIDRELLAEQGGTMKKRLEALLYRYDKIEMNMTRNAEGKPMRVFIDMYDNTEFAVIHADGKDLAPAIENAMRETYHFNKLCNYDPHA